MASVFPDSSGSNHPLRFFSAPGRINLIGEHVDYAGGIVMPAAIDFRVSLSLRKTETAIFRIHSLDFHSTVSTKTLEYDSVHPWVNYILGVVSEAKKKGLYLSGFDLAFTGNIPQGAGLSSSAAVEVATAFALSRLFDWGLSQEEIALLGQAAENHFVGVNCGIMDQFIISTAKKDSCISLDTSALKYEYLPLDLPGFEFYLIDSKVKHNLKESDYNQRRQEVESAERKFRPFSTERKSLYDVDPNLMDRAGLSPEERKRTLHITGEKNRVQNVTRCLQNGDAIGLGKELYACHESLSQNFQVSCEETDFIVDYLHSGEVVGARMIGGGFGGCVLVLDRENRSGEIFSGLQKKYEQRFGFSPEIYRFRISDGVKEDP